MESEACKLKQVVFGQNENLFYVAAQHLHPPWVTTGCITARNDQRLSGAGYSDQKQSIMLDDHGWDDLAAGLLPQDT
jgi:hypothetical protein